MGASILFWRRTDVAGLERLQLVSEPDGVLATSTVLCLEDGGFHLDHRWRLDADWRAQSVIIERWNAHGHGLLRRVAPPCYAAMAIAWAGRPRLKRSPPRLSIRRAVE